MTPVTLKPVTPQHETASRGIAQRVTAYRAKHKLSTMALAKLAGVSAQVIKDLEKPGCNPKLSTLFAVSAVIGVPVPEMLKAVEAPVGSWLVGLPEGYHQAAVSNAYAQDPSRLHVRATGLLDALAAAFIWDKSAEGAVFWRGVRIKLVRGQALPPWPVENK